MKPIDYSKTSRYGETMMNARAAQAMSNSPLKNRGMPELEAQFYTEGMNHALKLAELGLQKDQFGSSLAEKQRQFDVGMKEQGRQFQMNMDFARDKFKSQRRQDNRAEILGMVNVGLGLGMGYLQYKQNRKQIEMNKIMMGYLSAKGGKK